MLAADGDAQEQFRSERFIAAKVQDQLGQVIVTRLRFLFRASANTLLQAIVVATRLNGMLSDRAGNPGVPSH
jgi:hypothetical protein